MALAGSQTRAGADPLAASTYRSPGLDLVVERLESPGRHELLDLGPAVAANVAFFAETPCKLHIEDLPRYLLPAMTPPAEDEPDDAFKARVDAAVGAALSAHAPGSTIDVVIGWDLFNYMDGVTIAALMARVAERCRTGSLLFLMVSTLDEIPAAPARITVSPDRRLHYRPSPGGTLANPRYTPLALERMMPRFQLFHSFLLGNGMQDYLFCCR